MSAITAFPQRCTTQNARRLAPAFHSGARTRSHHPSHHRKCTVRVKASADDDNRRTPSGVILSAPAASSESVQQ
eukprot:7599857-Pyramimonas_sp.AAC.1